MALLDYLDPNMKELRLPACNQVGGHYYTMSTKSFARYIRPIRNADQVVPQLSGELRVA